jgi:osmotically-inducible protein OsmY
VSERTEIRPGAEVFGAEDVIGRVGRVVVSPASRAVTALEVTRLLRPAVVLPIEAVEAADPDSVRTNLTSADVDNLPEWRDEAFITPPGDWRSPTGHLAEQVRLRLPRLPGLGRLAPAPGGQLEATAGGMPVRAGQEVVGRDGRVGSLSQVLLDSATHRVGHFVMRREGVSGREVIVPVDWVESVTRDRITLCVGEEQLGRLPAYRPDDQLTADALDVLWYRSNVPTDDLRFVAVQTRDGIVELSGTTGTDQSAAAIEAVIRRLPGVLGVRNNLTSFEALARATSGGTARPAGQPSPQGGDT